jgi:hypothetical protein
VVVFDRPIRSPVECVPECVSDPCGYVTEFPTAEECVGCAELATKRDVLAPEVADLGG